MSRKHEYRKRLWQERDGLCHWCGIKTVLPPSGRILRHQPANLATIDHLDDRLSERRGCFEGWEGRRTVLSCFRCNQARARESEAMAVGKVELWVHA